MCADVEVVCAVAAAHHEMDVRVHQDEQAAHAHLQVVGARRVGRRAALHEVIAPAAQGVRPLAGSAGHRVPPPRPDSALRC